MKKPSFKTITNIWKHFLRQWLYLQNNSKVKFPHSLGTRIMGGWKKDGWVNGFAKTVDIRRRKGCDFFNTKKSSHDSIHAFLHASHSYVLPNPERLCSQAQQVFSSPILTPYLRLKIRLDSAQHKFKRIKNIL